MSETRSESATELFGHAVEYPRDLLVIDDDPVSRAILERTFQGKCAVWQACNGAEALEVLAARAPEFVITDLNMPVMDGTEFIRSARSDYLGAVVPILVLSAEGQEHVLLEAFRCGADDYMLKPFSTREILLRVCSIHLRQKLARDVNPLTRLPGNLVLKREIERRLQGLNSTAFAYIDLDHFKAFNDSQGFDKGDQVIELVGRILRDFAAESAPGEVFVGHVGGDDFVLLLPAARVSELESLVCTRFRRETREFFTSEEAERGTYRARNRQGDWQEFPLLSLSIGVVSNEHRPLDDYRLVSQIAAEVKKQAKSIPGGGVFVDQRGG